MHRTLTITVPATVTEPLCQQLTALPDVIGLSVQAGASRKPPGDIITVHVLNRGADETLRAVRALVPNLHDLSIASAELTSIIAPADAERVMKDKDEAIWEEIESGLRHQGRVTSNYLSLMALGGIMAAIGLVSDPVPQAIAFIASSIVSPGFEPLVKIPLGLVLRRWQVAWRGLGSSVAGYALFALAAGLTMWGLLSLGATSAEELATNPEVKNLVHPGTKEVLLSACGAAAGVIIVAAYRRSIIAGALIALVLMPAVALIGSGLVIGRPDLAWEGFIRFLADAGFILGFGTLIFFLKQLTVHRRQPIE